jgi:tetratricopeptide (TPR) repeat protein
MSMRSIFAALLIFVTANATTVPAAEPALEIFTVYSAVKDTGEEDGVIWFEFPSVAMRFVMARSSISDPDRAVAALTEAMEAGDVLTVRFYPASGGIDAATGKPTFVIAGFFHSERSFVGEEGPQILRYASRTSAGGQALCNGIALNLVGRVVEARPFLDRAAADRTLAELPRALAFMSRAEGASWEAKHNTPPGEVRDRLLVAALGDYRTWSLLRPANQSAAMRVAESLWDLGAYDEALEQLQFVLRTWPDDTFWTRLQMGLVYRTRGQYDLALAAVDAITEQYGPQDGMAFHYHRGWTLLAMNRPEDAISELTEGLKHQDFLGAYGRRACAFAKLGKLREALSDIDDVMRLYRQGKAEAQFGVTLREKYDLQQASIVAEKLRRAVDRNEAGPMEAVCHIFWEDEFLMKPRPRSALLPRPNSAPNPG